MFDIRIRAGVAALALVFATSLAAAQTTTQPKSSTTMDKPASQSTVEDVKTWTQKKWNSAKSEWRKDKTKWDSCNQQSTTKHLTGRASWSFIYDCMKA